VEVLGLGEPPSALIWPCFSRGSCLFLRFIYGLRLEYVKMFERSSHSGMHPSGDLGVMLLDELRDAVLRVRRARRWFLVDPLTRAFVRACMIMRVSRVRSMVLMKAIFRAIRALREVVSEKFRLIRVGVREAWRLSELASSWGHKTAREWRQNRAYIMVQALTLQWVLRLLNITM